MASDIVITPNRGSTTVNAKIDFTGASTASSQIRLEVLPDNSLSFVGTAGSLFSIADSVTGSLMSVNDASGLPILEVFDTDKVVMGQYNQNTLVVNGTQVGIGTGSPTNKLTIAGVNSNGITLTGSNATITAAGTTPNLILTAGTNIYARPGSGYDLIVDSGNGINVTTGNIRAPAFYYSSDTNSRWVNGYQLYLRGTSPTIWFRDTDQNSAMIHVNSNIFYILRGANDTETWTQVNSRWPMEIDLTNNNMAIGGNLNVAAGTGTVTAATFSGALSGNATTATTLQTARNLTINGTARSFNGSADISWTAADIGLTSYLPLTGGTISSNLTITGNLTVNGTTTTVNSTTTTLDDPIITLGGDTAPGSDDNKDRGVEFRWHNGTAAKVGFFGYDDSTGYFTFIPDSTNTSEVFSGTKGTIDANLIGNVTGNVSGTAGGETLATVTGRGATTTSAIGVTGGAKITIQNGVDGGNTRGLLLWTDTDTNWGIYMAQAGAGKSLAAGTSVSSIDGRSAHHIRYRVANSSTQGHLWENSSEQVLMSLTGDTGNLYTRGQIYAGNSTSNLVIHTGNYNSYAPTLTGTGASGTWGISITGNAGTATTWQTARNFTIGSTARSVNGSSDYSWTVADIGAAVGLPAYQAWSFDSVKTPGLYQYDGAIGATKPPDGSANYRTIEVGSSTRYSQIALPWDSDNMYFRRQTNSTWTTWRTVLTDGNYNSYSPTLTGTGASGTWGISITGNAATATSADQIDGVAFRNTGSNAGTAADSLEQNGITYVNSNISLLGQSDGALFSQAYNSNWQHQIYGDYRTGQIVVRGKNNGTWQAWRTVLDSSNYTSYTGHIGNGTLTLNTSGNGISGSTSFTANQSGAGTFTVTSNATAANTASTIVFRDGSGNFAAGQITGTSFLKNSITVPGMFVQAGSTGAPSAIQNGDLWWNTETGKLKIWYSTSSAWVDATSVPDLANYFPVAGGNITGNVSIGGLLNTTGNITARNGQTHSLSMGHHPSYGTSWAGVWRTGSDYALITNSSDTLINAPSGSVGFRVANSQYAHVATDGVHTSYWFRNDANNTGLYNTNTTQHLSSSANGYWDMSSTTALSGIRLYTGGHVSSLRGYVYANNSNEVGFLNHTGGWAARFTSSVSELYQDTYVPTLYANIMYDRQNAGFYVDPGSTSVLNRLNVAGYSMRSSATLDLSNTGTYSTTNYYPITIPLATGMPTRMRIVNALNSNVPSWSTHGSGFTCHVEWTSNGSGWGTIAVQRSIHRYTEGYTNSTICGGITQMTNGSIEVIWLRGGGRYYFEADADVTPTIQSTTYTNNGQSVTPGSAPQNDVLSAATDTRPSFQRLNLTMSTGTAPMTVSSTTLVTNLNADLLDGYNSAETGSSIILRTQSNGYLNIDNWIQVGGAGLFTGVNNAHWTPNQTSAYSPWRIINSRGSYGGIYDDYSGVNWMHDSAGNGGIYRQANSRWFLYHNVSENCLGIGGSSTLNGWRARVNGALYTDAGTYSSAFYASSNSTYYLDLAGAVSGRINGRIYIGTTTSYTAGGSPNLTIVKTSAGARADHLELRNESTNANTACSINFMMTGGDSSNPNARIVSTRSASFDGTLEFYVGGNLTTGIFINSSGNVGIGRTDPGYKLDVNGSTRIVTALGVGTAPSGTTGEIRATDNITAYYSDERLKTKLGAIENPIEKVKSLSGFYFEANETAVALGYQKKREVGVSAQEVQAILPEIIAPAPIDDKYMTVRYEKLIPLLIEAIKAQQVQIEELQKLIKEKA